MGGGGEDGTRTGTSHWISLIWPPLPALTDHKLFRAHGWLGLSLRHLSQEVYRGGGGGRGSGGESRREASEKTVGSLSPSGLPIPRRDHSQFLRAEVGGNEGPGGSFPFRLGPAQEQSLRAVCISSQQGL